jgi:[NiFe] hydrogenase diaphorase moiety large subunit
MESVKSIISRHGKDRNELLAMIRDIQASRGHVPREALAELAGALDLSEADVEGVVTFYHFFSLTPAGNYAVHLDDSVTAWMNGRAAVARAFEDAAGCRFGATTADGLIGLHDTSCIGMNDQEPAAIINGVVFTRLTEEAARNLVAAMKAGTPVVEMAKTWGDGSGLGHLDGGANQSELIRAMVANNIVKKGPVLFGPFASGSAVRKAAALKPEGVIDEIKKANLLGRGGAGFPTGLKWEFCRREKAPRHYVVCNADEGEPGTFKDRVILTEVPRLVFEGMAVAGYAVGAGEGLLYLRAEYAYLKARLESVLEELRREKVLGKSVAGIKGFDFDIKIKLGAGAYVCGEESALIESAEGKRGEPRDRPPFPVQTGYLDKPTTVNNVETLATAAQIIAHDAAWFKSMGIPTSAGTKLLSVSGDCSRPGVYEVEFGLSVRELLDMAGARDAQAVQVGGPSGNCISPKDFERKISFTALSTGGSIIVFGPGRDLFEVVRNFMEFFVEESCGWCTPCRAGNAILLRKFGKIAGGKASRRDLEEIESWGKIIKASSRCGLGQTSPNPILTTLKNFPELYEARVRKDADFVPEFDLAASMAAGCEAAGRKPACKETHHE